MKAKGMRENLLVLLVCVAVGLAAYGVAAYREGNSQAETGYTITDRASSCTEEADSRFHVLTQPAQYPVGDTTISIEVANEGEHSVEVFHPELEVEKNGRWCCVDYHGDRPANLLGISAGETSQFDIHPRGLPAGKYRAVFGLWGEDGYFAYYFELI